MSCPGAPSVALEKKNAARRRAANGSAASICTGSRIVLWRQSGAPVSRGVRRKIGMDFPVERQAGVD
jgi:hypothetical protein